MKYTPAPVVLFTYKRLDTLRQTVAALQSNNLSSDSELFIFSDAAKHPIDEPLIEQIRTFNRSITGFKKVYFIEATKNMGLGNSIINGVSKVIKDYGKVIVLEDDLVTSPNFLQFMNAALDVYEFNSKIYSISGYTFPMKVPPEYGYDNYFTKRASSWGWATWKDRWEKVDWEVSDYNEFSNSTTKRRRFNEMGSDMSNMLARQMKGKISSWAIRWCYHQFKIDALTVFPIQSKVLNVGFGEAATHTRESYNRFKTVLDKSGKCKFSFNPIVKLDPFFIRQFVSRFSIRARIYSKLRNLITLS